MSHLLRDRRHGEHFLLVEISQQKKLRKGNVAGGEFFAQVENETALHLQDDVGKALGISTDLMPGVLSANLIEGGIHFGLGATLAMRKRDLAVIGGFEAIVDYLADDYQLGRRIAESNLRVELSRTSVETQLPAYNLSGFITHQLRWMRTIRASRPGGCGSSPNAAVQARPRSLSGRRCRA